MSKPGKGRIEDWLMRSVASFDDLIDIRWRSLKNRLGLTGVPQIQAYIAYSNDTTAWLHGRVLTNPPAELPADEDRWRENVVNTYRRFASDEVAGVEVEIILGQENHIVTSDHEGYFHLQAEHSFRHTADGLWTQAICRIVNSPLVSAEASATTAKVMNPPTDAQIGIISDVDDTVIYTGATQLASMIWLTFMSNAITRVPFDGVSAFYTALQAGNTPDSAPRNPIFYVSSSPWNLFDVIEDIFFLNQIPLGPILLRDLGFDQNKFLKEGHEHKLEKIRRILAAYPGLPFVLIGDSGQDDAHLYAQAATEFGPSRIAAIYIRDIDPDAQSRHDSKVRSCQNVAAKSGVVMLLVSDSKEAALDAAGRELIHPSRLAAIGIDTQCDRMRKDAFSTD